MDLCRLAFFNEYSSRERDDLAVGDVRAMEKHVFVYSYSSRSHARKS